MTSEEAFNDLSVGQRIMMFRDCCLICWNEHVLFQHEPEHVFINIEAGLFDCLVGPVLTHGYDFFTFINEIRVSVDKHVEGWSTDFGSRIWDECTIPRPQNGFAYRRFFDFVNPSEPRRFEFVWVCDDHRKHEFLIPFESAKFDLLCP